MTEEKVSLAKVKIIQCVECDIGKKQSECKFFEPFENSNLCSYFFAGACINPEAGKELGIESVD
jgi:hypothetical protein